MRISDGSSDVCSSDLVRGIAAAQEALFAEAPADIAGQIATWFPAIERAALARMIEGYRASGVWARSPALPAATFVRLKASLLSGGLIAWDVPYNRAVDDAVRSEEPTSALQSLMRISYAVFCLTKKNKNTS